VYDDVEVAARIISDYDLFAIPVVDKAGRALFNVRGFGPPFSVT